jgi:hypothetical protein
MGGVTPDTLVLILPGSLMLIAGVVLIARLNKRADDERYRRPPKPDADATKTRDHWPGL